MRSLSSLKIGFEWRPIEPGPGHGWVIVFGFALVIGAYVASILR
ncbi:MAG TPA: hypothetical protein VE866_08355 [Candidatus Binatia bacterium]|jgi:hypothetical protein|nr:hypothetical protein [Candidatus Binatia bacterium]